MERTKRKPLILGGKKTPEELAQMRRDMVRRAHLSDDDPEIVARQRRLDAAAWTQEEIDRMKQTVHFSE